MKKIFVYLSQTFHLGQVRESGLRRGESHLKVDLETSQMTHFIGMGL
tara:strand:- start:2789 stop:2929 length:141 start_codon:yes stop_codon:yes gene_type:complete